MKKLDKKNPEMEKCEKKMIRNQSVCFIFHSTPPPPTSPFIKKPFPPIVLKQKIIRGLRDLGVKVKVLSLALTYIIIFNHAGRMMLGYCDLGSVQYPQWQHEPS